MGEKNRSGVRAEVRDGRKILVIDFRYKDKDGREQRYRRDASVQAVAGARAEAERLKRLAVERGSLEVEAAPLKFSEYVEQTYVPLVMSRLKPSTREGYDRLLFGPHGLVERLGRKRLDAIGAVDARAVEAEALERHVLPRYALVCMRSVLRSAVELEALAHMPRLPKVPPRSEKLLRAPPEEVVKRVLAASTGWHRTGIALALLGGLRMGEVRALEVRDVDIENGCLVVRRAYSANVVVEPKGRDEKPVPLAPMLRAILAEAIAGKGPLERVVTRARGVTPSEGGLDNALRRIQRRLGVETVWSLHKLRHFFGTTMLRNGANVETVRELLRHRDLASTARYMHATSRDMTEAVALLGGNWGETTDRPCP